MGSISDFSVLTEVSTSFSKITAIWSETLSSAPDSSPVASMSVTIGGTTFDCLKGFSSPSPRSMDSRTCTRSSAKAVFPTASFVRSRVSSIDMPALSSVAKVWAKSATTFRVKIFPNIGIFSFQ